MAMEKSIVLCGFMGCGKSAVGRRLAYYTHRTLIDMDSEIEKIAGMKISELFSAYGEQNFRRLETEYIRGLVCRKRMIISAGGGALLSQENQQLFRESGCYIVLIDTSLPELQRRLKNDVRRPLLQQPDRERVIEELYRKRIDIYRKAACVIVDGDRNLDAVAHQIMTATGILTENHFKG